MKKIALYSILLLTISNSNAAIIMDSVNGFSGIQGQDGWFYGYYDGDSGEYLPGDFEQMTEFNTNVWEVQNGVGGFWTRLDAQGGHPNGAIDSGGRQNIIHWSVRRWVSDKTGTLSLGGNLSAFNTVNGNGTVGHIFVDGIEVFNQYISGTDAVGIDYLFDVNINTGSIIDFAIDPFDSDGRYDATNFTVTGDFSILPIPATAWLFGLGLIGLVGIKKYQN